MEEQQGEIRIYVACLAAYNNGNLHGCWINANQDENAIREAIAAMLLRSPVMFAEEYAIHDYEGFEGVGISEFADIASVSEIAGFIAEHGKLGGKLVEYFGNLNDAREAIGDHYAGQYQSIDDFAQELTEQSTQIPENLRYYIDWEHMGRDLEINDVLTIETDFRCIHVFWRH